MVTLRPLRIALAAGVCIAFGAAAQNAPKPAAPAKPAEQAKPTELDLRAAYCRPVIAGAINRYAQDAAASQQHAAALQRARRIELYILPRLNIVEPAGILAAQARGREDNAKLNERLGACRAQCKGTDPVAPSGCVQQCAAADEAVKRASDCDDIGWLPLQEKP